MKKIALLLIFNSQFLIINSFAQTISAGANQSFVLCSDSTVRSWGWNPYGQLGNGTNTDSNIPVQVSALSGIKAIAGGGGHCLALKNDSTLMAWGGNFLGQLGNGTNTDSNIPVQVSALSDITAIAGGDEEHSLALKSDGTLWTWGRNFEGQLGIGISGWGIQSNLPVQVSVLSGMIAIAGGRYHSLAVKNDGTAWAWGANGAGQLGNGTTTESNVPVQISALSGIIAIAGGGWHSLALKNDGTVWTWGGSLVPVQVIALSGITAIAAGEHHSLALKNDGTVWAWGGNNSGQLGTGNNTSSNVPVQVSALSGITAIAAGNNHSLALKNDGTVWAWGFNNYGQVGNGTNTSSNVPVQVTGLCQILTGLEEEIFISTINIFPNPISNSTTISFSLTQSQKVSLNIFNVNGRLVSTLADKMFETGENKLIWNADEVDVGIYFLQVQTIEIIKTEKLIVTK